MTNGLQVIDFVGSVVSQFQELGDIVDLVTHQPGQHSIAGISHGYYIGLDVYDK